MVLYLDVMCIEYKLTNRDADSLKNVCHQLVVPRSRSYSSYTWQYYTGTIFLVPKTDPNYNLEDLGCI